MTGRLLRGPRWTAKAGRCDPRLRARALLRLKPSAFIRIVSFTCATPCWISLQHGFAVQLSGGAYPMPRQGGGPRPPPAAKTVGCNTAFDLTLSSANLRNTRYVTRRIEDRAMLPLNPRPALLFFPG